ncbi:hypothetical protein DNTS_023009 [Danionella cerebrum]|uniref:Peptidyl-prolyl cis-trans isomerase H n=1 Tax=Danionella cerebrum TaxID=2873325 RepID=A0A553RBC6_9TELE|nr:hypothetical protein DNTS_023009 [Danionella translucida]
MSAMNVQPSNPNNPIVFFDVSIGGQEESFSSKPPEAFVSGSVSSWAAAALEKRVAPVSAEMVEESQAAAGGEASKMKICRLLLKPLGSRYLKPITDPICLQEVGRMKIELFADIVPKTAENFRQFCTGEFKKDGVPVGYKGCTFHRVIKDFMIQGGDFVNGDGTGICSVYRGPFADENFRMKHSGPGLLSMANSGPGTNGCQFFITCTKCDWLDGKHVVFGKVVDGLLVMRKIENVPTGPNNKPKLPIVVAQCGEIPWRLKLIMLKRPGSVTSISRLFELYRRCVGNLISLKHEEPQSWSKELTQRFSSMLMHPALDANALPLSARSLTQKPLPPAVEPAQRGSFSPSAGGVWPDSGDWGQCCSLARRKRLGDKRLHHNRDGEEVEEEL